MADVPTHPAPTHTAAAQQRAGGPTPARFVGILPAAGGGSRLQPLRSAKELLPILYVETEDGAGLQPIAAAEFALASMHRAGVRHCFVIASDAKPEIARYLGNGQDRDMALGYLIQPAPNGLADAVDTAYPWVRADHCCLALPDTVFSPPDALDRVCRQLVASDADLVLGVFPVPNPTELGPVRMDAGGAVLEILEKPAQTDLANSWGIAAWSPAFTEFLHARLAADGPGRHPSIGTLFHAALAAGLRVRAVAFPGGEYLDAGTQRGLRRLVEAWSGASTRRPPPPDASTDALAPARPPESADRFLQVVRALRAGQVGEARRLARDGTLTAPDADTLQRLEAPDTLAGALIALANALTDDGARDRATCLARAAAVLAPDDPAVHAGLVRLALADGRLDEALAHAWQRVDLAPDAAAQVLLGDALLACGQRADARAAFEEAVRLDPENKAAHRRLGDWFAAERDVERADLHFQRAIMVEPSNIDNLRAFAWWLHDTDRLERAEAVAQLAAKTAPDDPLAHHLLGWLHKRRGRNAEGRAALERAVALDPTFLLAIRVLADLEIAAGALASAEARLRAAIATAPDDAGLHHTLAWVIFDLGDFAAAEDAARRAAELAPDDLATYGLLARVLIERERFDAATGIAVALLALQPDRAEAAWLLGEIHFRRRQYATAETWLIRALASDPGFVQARARLGSLQVLLGLADAGEANLRAAIDGNPDFATSYRELAVLLDRQGRFADAETTLLALLERRPGDALGWFALGRVLGNDRRDAPAADALCRAVALDPGIKEAWWHLGRLAVGGVPAARDAFEALAPEDHRTRLAGLVDAAIGWLGFDEYRAIVAHALARFPGDDLFEAARQFGNVYDVDYTQEAQRAEADQWGARTAPRSLARRTGAARPHVAYVGNHLHRELMDGYVGFHDHERFEFSLFTNDTLDKLPHRDPRLAVHRLRNVDLEQACAVMGVDLVVDIVGPYPRANLIEPFLALRQRVAPIQCLWLNTFATTGHPAYDYVISDRSLVRPGDEPWFSERILRLPGCHWFWTPPEHTLEPGPLPMLRNGHVTFGSANRGLKLNDDVLTLWADVMSAVPDARLRLIGWHTESWRLRRHILARFAERGVDGARLDFLPQVHPERLPAFYHSVDLTLDTFPFNGGLTTFEALWMGVPVVALAGNRFTSRQSEDILGMLGLDRWVAADRAGFVALAAALARDVDQLAAARATLRRDMLASPLCDGRTFARALEGLYLQMLDGAP